MKAVFHLDWNDEKILGLALTNIDNLLKACPDAKAHVLANGPAVNLFRNGASAEQGKLGELLKHGVEVSLCRNALRKFEIPETEIFPGCKVVPAGIPALIELQEQGFAYIKP